MANGISKAAQALHLDPQPIRPRQPRVGLLRKMTNLKLLADEHRRARRIRLGRVVRNLPRPALISNEPQAAPVQPQRSRELTHFCSWKRTQQVRMSLWSGGLIGR